VLRSGREEPYLRIQDIIIFVRDLDLSLRFYVDQLGFELIADKTLPSFGRWIEVAPPDGSANLTLFAPKPDQPKYYLIGGNRWILFMTEDVHAKYKGWSERGVHFLSSPENPVWGGTFTRFEDPDGNLFGLEGFDEVRRSLELRRQAQAEKLESERRAARELEIAKQVQARLFPQIQPELKTVEYAGICLQARQVGGDYFDFLNLGPQRLGLIIGDVSGKGIAAALLMTNLQASLRSQSMPKQDSHLGIGRRDGAGSFVLTTSDVDVKDTAEPIKMDIVRTGTYTIDNEGRGIISLDNGQFVLRFYAASKKNLLVMRPGYDVIGVGTAEQPSFPAD
jgi:catechol 2,3-dioxygenase-like lactoylglutathione lyase family enzyme